MTMDVCCRGGFLAETRAFVGRLPAALEDVARRHVAQACGGVVWPALIEDRWTPRSHAKAHPPDAAAISRRAKQIRPFHSWERRWAAIHRS